MGEKQNQPFQLSFNTSLTVDFQRSRVTSDGRLVLVRELDERLALGELIEQHFTDPRGTNTRLPLSDLLRQSVYSRLARYEDVNDAERLSQDPTLRLIGSEKIWERGAVPTSRLQSFETEIPVYGQQEQSACNGHLESTYYHPLLLFNREGDCLAAKLRPGNVHSADGWEDMLLPEIERQQKLGKEVVFRADAASRKNEPQAGGLVQELSLPGGQLEDDATELPPIPLQRGAADRGPYRDCRAGIQARKG